MKSRRSSLAGVKSLELASKPKKGRYIPRNPLSATEVNTDTKVRRLTRQLLAQAKLDNPRLLALVRARS
jgi:hypothetical protein